MTEEEETINSSSLFNITASTTAEVDTTTSSSTADQDSSVSTATDGSSTPTGLESSREEETRLPPYQVPQEHEAATPDYGLRVRRRIDYFESNTDAEKGKKSFAQSAIKKGY